MAPTAPVAPFNLRAVLEKNKLNGTNYADWIRNLRIVLRSEKKENILDEPLDDVPDEDASATVRNAYQKAYDASMEVSCLMLACMEPDLQMQFESTYDAHEMFKALQEMFQTQARTERFNVSKAFVECKLAEGAPVGPHIIKMVVMCRGWRSWASRSARSWRPISSSHLCHLAMGTSSQTTICMAQRRA